jgi:hypothetical protein
VTKATLGSIIVFLKKEKIIRDESYFFLEKISDESLSVQMERSSRVRVAFPHSVSLFFPSDVHPLAPLYCTSSEPEISGGGGDLSAGFSYRKFVHFALEKSHLRSTVVPHISQVLAILLHQLLISYTFFSWLS